MSLPISPDHARLPRTWWIWILAILIGVIGVAVVTVTYLLHDQARWIAVLEQRASLASGRDVHITGLTLQLWPTPAAQATGLTIANPAWTHDPYLVQAQTVSAHFALWPLLRGKLQLTSLAASGIALDLETAADGAHSWIRTNSSPSTGKRADSALDLGQLRAISLHNLDARYRAPGRAPDAPHWLLDHLDVHANPGLRDIGLDALLRHGGRTLEASGRFDQLAALAHGELTLHSGATQMRLTGQLPLRGALHGADFTVSADAERLDDTLAFFDIVTRPIAPLHLAATLREHDGKLLATGVDVRLAAMQVRGAVQLDLHADKPILDAQLHIPRLDWVQTLFDAGRPPLPPKLPGELFRTHRLAWRVLTALRGWHGTVDLDIGALKTRPGIELTDARARLHFDDDVLQVAPMQAGMLGGHAVGTLRLT
ncbi:MAG: AsmA family protein, partial [Pseudomonadota bacterium]|nr:AsmA family protein [Pseudomonadota bacterium]